MTYRIIFLITFTIMCVFPAFSAETVYGGSDLRREPADTGRPQKVTARSSLVPRFQPEKAEAKAKLADLAKKAAWYKALSAQLKKTLAQAATPNERDIISRKLSSVNSEAVGTFAKEDAYRSYLQAMDLADGNGYFKDNAKALSLLNRAAANGFGRNLHFYRAYIYFDTKRYADSFSEFRKAEAENKEDRHTLYHSAMALFYLKKYEQAIVYFTKNINIDEGYAESYYYRGLAYFRLGQFEKAVADYNTASGLDKNLSKPY